MNPKELQITDDSTERGEEVECAKWMSTKAHIQVAKSHRYCKVTVTKCKYDFVDTNMIYMMVAIKINIV